MGQCFPKWKSSTGRRKPPAPGTSNSPTNDIGDPEPPTDEKSSTGKEQPPAPGTSNSPTNDIGDPEPPTDEKSSTGGEEPPTPPTKNSLTSDSVDPPKRPIIDQPTDDKVEIQIARSGYTVYFDEKEKKMKIGYSNENFRWTRRCINGNGHFKLFHTSGDVTYCWHVGNNDNKGKVRVKNMNEIEEETRIFKIQDSAKQGRKLVFCESKGYLKLVEKNNKKWLQITNSEEDADELKIS